MNQVANTVEFAPAVINVEGSTKSERQLSVIHSASSQTKFALANAKGKLGQAARNGIAVVGLKSIAAAAAKANYRPAAEYFAARMGTPFVITSRASFDALADVFEAKIMQAKLAKNGGYVTDKKTGALKPSPTHALALELKAIAIELIAEKEAVIAAEKAERETKALA